MYSIELSTKVQKFLNKLDNQINKRIEEKLKKLKDNPVPSDTKFVGRYKGEKIFRYRIGNYRALYKIKENQNIILITKLDKRPKIYK